MAKRNQKGKKHGKIKPSVLSMAPLAVPIGYGYLGYKSGGWTHAADSVLQVTTGMHFYALGGGEGTGFKAERLVPLGATLLATYGMKKLVGMTGANRAMGAFPFRW